MDSPLKILIVHNHYQQRGGEDSVFETECAMLEAAGHRVHRYEKHNDEIGVSREKSVVSSSGRGSAPDPGSTSAPLAAQKEGSGFRVQGEEKVLGTRYQVLANTRFPKKDNPQALAPSPYHLAPSPTPTHPHTHTLPPNPVKKTWRSLRSLRENDLTPSSPSTPRSLYSHTETQRHREDQISCQSCNPVNKPFRAFSCFSWLKKHFTPSSPSSPRSLSSHTETQSHREEIVSTPPNKNLRESAESANKITYPTSVLSVVSVVEKLLSPFVRFVSFVVNKPSLFFATIWSRQSYREITALIREHHPDIVHCHNTFPLISPSVYWAAAKQGVPVVQTLHNYRLICINPYLYRNGRICEDCLGRSPLRGMIHRCYRGSFSASFTVAAMLMIHRLLGTYRNKVTTYIALTEFGRRKFLEARLCDPSKVVVKPNAVGAFAPTAEGSGFRVQDEETLSRALSKPEQRLAASGQGLANTQFPPTDSSQELVPQAGGACPQDMAPKEPHLNAGVAESARVQATTSQASNDAPPSSQSCQSCNPVKKTWRSLQSLRENDLTPSSPSTPRSLYSHTETQSHREGTVPTADSRPFASIRGSSTPPTVLYAGRLSPEKGPYLLLEAWKLFLDQLNDKRLAAKDSQGSGFRVQAPEALSSPPTHSYTHTPTHSPDEQPRLLIIGDGPERNALEAVAANIHSIHFLGAMPKNQVAEHMGQASLLVFPSVWQETFGLTILEAAALGTPAIVSDIGGQASLIEVDSTGYTFRSGSAESLAETLAKALADPARLAAMGRHAQARFLAGDCPPERNVAALSATYGHSVAVRRCQQVNTSVRALGARTRHVCSPSEHTQENPPPPAPPPACGH